MGPVESRRVVYIKEQGDFDPLNGGKKSINTLEWQFKILKYILPCNLIQSGS